MTGKTKIQFPKVVTHSFCSIKHTCYFSTIHDTMFLFQCNLTVIKILPDLQVKTLQFAFTYINMQFRCIKCLHISVVIKKTDVLSIIINMSVNLEHLSVRNSNWWQKLRNALAKTCPVQISRKNATHIKHTIWPLWIRKNIPSKTVRVHLKYEFLKHAVEKSYKNDCVRSSSQDFCGLLNTIFTKH